MLRIKPGPLGERQECFLCAMQPPPIIQSLLLDIGSQVFAKIIGALTCLYFFICSLDFLSTSFRLLAGRGAGEVFANSDLLQNPIVGLMLGILVTVLLQSSSTTTSIIVGMVAGQILTVR